jgi:hypothetical protein
MATTIRARIYARGEVSFAKFLFLTSWFAKLLEANFSCFAKIIWMPSWFAKLLELLSHALCAIRPAPLSALPHFVRFSLFVFLNTSVSLVPSAALAAGRHSMSSLF